MKYSVEQDKETEKWCVYDSDSGEKLSEWDSRRQATREMGRLNTEAEAAGAKGKSEATEDEDEEDK